METCDFPFCMRTVRRVIDAKYPSREKRVESILTKAGNIGSGRKTNSNLLLGTFEHSGYKDRSSRRKAKKRGRREDEERKGWKVFQSWSNFYKRIRLIRRARFINRKIKILVEILVKKTEEEIFTRDAWKLDEKQNCKVFEILNKQK